MRSAEVRPDKMAGEIERRKGMRNQKRVSQSFIFGEEILGLGFVVYIQ